MSVCMIMMTSAAAFHFKRFVFPILILLHLPCPLSGELVTLSIGTYNLWNVMFNWEVRLQHITDMIRQNDLDIVVFQEVRLDCKGAPATTMQSCPSQLDEVRWRLPEYRWVLAYPAGTVTKTKLSIIDGWQFEGLGIISRRPILSSNAIRLRQTTVRDTNKRIALHVKVMVGPRDEDDGGVVDILVVHFSYDPQQQCDNANDVVKFISGSGPRHTIILGDFNAYNKLSPAIGQFVGLPIGEVSCKRMTGDDGRRLMGNFKDVWLSDGKNHHQGLSFSNMPTPGLQSRPDRILVNKQMVVTSVGMDGNESVYWEHYQLSSTIHRARRVCRAAYHSFVRLDGYSCLHDCGPHGSCRCGVCVKGGNSNNCYLPNCFECSGAKFVIFILSFLLVTIFSFLFMLSVIRILVVSARFNQEDIMDILGYRCCLFNRQLFQIEFKVIPRRFKMRLMSIFRLCNLPPAWAALVSSLLLCCTSIVIYYLFQDAINVIMSVLPEEKFPSDHKMVFTSIKLL